MFENLTDIDTTLHPHGIRLNNAFDGIHNITQPPILPTEKFTYRVFFRDPGIYWYHAHLKDWYTRELGAYGAFLVRPKDPNYFNRDEVLILSAIDIGESTSQPHMPTHMMMGRFGNTLLVNGNTDYNLHVKKNDIVRFFFLNAADVRPYNIAIPGVRMKMIGSDNGKSEREVFTDNVVISPAERYILEARFDSAGERTLVHQTPSGATVLGRIFVEDSVTTEDYGARFLTLKENSEVIADIAAFRPYFDKPVDRRLNMTLAFDMMGMDGHAGVPQIENVASGTPLWNRTNNIEWEDSMPMMNMESGMHNTLWKLVDPATGKDNMDILWSFRQGDIVKIELFNDPNSPQAMQHPIHFHGQRFLVLSINGDPNPILQWKDTVLVRPGERTQILLETSNPGDWIFHCHIGRHTIEQGANMTMTGRFRVDPKPAGGL